MADGVPAPQPAPQGAQGQPPSGASPATQPVPNAGAQAAGVAKVGVIVKLMEDTLPQLGVGSEIGRDLLKALSTLSKHVPAGAVSPGIENQAMQRLATNARQMQPQIAAMRASQGGAPPPSM